jgi:hypothetical protein
MQQAEEITSGDNDLSKHTFFQIYHQRLISDLQQTSLLFQ